MFEWMKKHKLLIALLSMFIILGVPFIIHILFKIYPDNEFFVAEWTAGELLGYYGSILAFIGTVVLGILALYQNKIIKEESDRRTALIETREYESNIPRFTLNPSGSNGNMMNLRIQLKNISENIANQIEIYNIRIIKKDDTEFWKGTKNYTFDSIPANTSEEFIMNNPAIYEEGYIFLLDMKAKDKFFVEHRYVIKGSYIKGEPFPVFKITEI